MKHKYRFHPSDYELGENEKFYSDMEARGWRLVKRGRYLSRFAPVEPSAARYRIEVYTPPFLEDRTLPEGAPLLVIVRRDMAKALGQRLAALLGARRPVAVLDGISADQGTFIDLGRPVMDGMALPVVVKTLLFG